nr:MAG TPA: hypothetical protein [Caudoviricetes sp.]
MESYCSLLTHISSNHTHDIVSKHLLSFLLHFTSSIITSTYYFKVKWSFSLFP